MSTDRFNIERIATLSRLDLSEEEKNGFASQLETILSYIDKLNALDVTGIEPTAHPAPVTDITRPDAARPGYGPDTLLLNAPRQAQGQLQVPRVVE